MVKKDKAWLLRKLRKGIESSEKRIAKLEIEEDKRFKRWVRKLVRMATERERGLVCKYCGSHNLVKYGRSNAKQVYMCKDCKRTFTDNDAMPLMHTPSMEIGSALSAYYTSIMYLILIYNEYRF